MSDRESRGGSWVTRTWGEFENDHCALLAASISYHVLFAFVPLVTFLVAMFGWITRDPAARQNAVDWLVQLLPLQASEDNLVLEMIRNVSSQTGTLTIIGALGLMWASTGIFGSIRSALNIAWGVPNKRGFFTDLLVDVGSLLGYGLLFASSMGATVALHSVQSSVLRLPFVRPDGVLHYLFLAAGLLLPATFSFIAFLLLFRFVPNVRHQVRDVWIGALVSAVLFEAGKHAFAFYVAHFNRYQSLYGTLGGVMLFMLWTYVSAITLLIGAEVAAERERRLRGAPASSRKTAPGYPAPAAEVGERDRSAYMPR
ncbi:MAG TPA: YihY/virulence factor BrkB family protein [Candidatus Eisenbacteria bacterium]|nr:YihY/virulence factor BrkB family protein [Candidatus Eisenbacteria bacterium]